jgi:hypothetical protein
MIVSCYRNRNLRVARLLRGKMTGEYQAAKADKRGKNQPFESSHFHFLVTANHERFATDFGFDDCR